MFFQNPFMFINIFIKTKKDTIFKRVHIIFYSFPILGTTLYATIAPTIITAQNNSHEINFNANNTRLATKNKTTSPPNNLIQSVLFIKNTSSLFHPLHHIRKRQQLLPTINHILQHHFLLS